MTESDIKGRLLVLEVLAMSSLGLLFTLTGATDPQHRKALTVLDGLKVAAKSRLSEDTDADAVAAGEAYLDFLLSELSENLGIMRPK